MVFLGAAIAVYLYFHRRKDVDSPQEMVLLPDKQDLYVIDLSQIVVGKLIGAGSFGYVYQGEYPSFIYLFIYYFYSYYCLYFFHFFSFFFFIFFTLLQCAF